ncbi:bifunctional oligoribonuclease/PAP phosphatase NrnA [candidate division KSB1 bacterium]|nr:bifunctional oligoribonuclease/PAP phosphatase NrnA [candidate division KSB1 bacterium]RQW06794.1 MAG: bifunctional oligoribonuclease/PAP phosphatase NrnA [candidate division KSB1 bacterium]
MRQHWTPILNFLADKKRILITTHINPDGDALGSEIALAHYLGQCGKQVHIINSDPLASSFTFLTGDVPVEQFSRQEHLRLIESCDGCLVLDVSEWKRLGDIGAALQETAIPLACIDHHLAGGKMGGLHVIDAKASSTGEMVYDLLLSAKATWTQIIVDALYTCILTDTGSFKFSNTTAKTHLVAADLLDKGAQFQKIYAELYESDSIGKSLLKGHLLAQMQFARDGRISWFVLSQELLQRTGAHEWETEGFSELARSIQSVEISIMFSETRDGRTKASFRSKGVIPINTLAEQFDGGGHKYAAGAALPWRLDESIPIVIAAAKKHLDLSSRDDIPIAEE